MRCGDVHWLIDHGAYCDILRHIAACCGENDDVNTALVVSAVQ